MNLEENNNCFKQTNEYHNRKASKTEKIAFPITVTIIILFLGFSTLFTEIIPPPHSFLKTICFFISLYLYIMSIICYFKTVLTSPGVTPINWEPNVSEKEKEYAKQRYEISVMKEQKLIDMLYPAQFCGTCQMYRPPRSYHCKKCGTCILKRDHHCPWVGNCVGFGNYKYFIQFLVYTTIVIIFSVCWHIYGFMRDYDSSIPFSSQFASSSKGVFRLICLFMDLAVTFSMIMMSITHVFSMLNNTTGQEHIELQMLRYNGSTKRRQSMYCKSIHQNFIETMGDTWIDWLFPTPIKGDGLSFIKVIDPHE